MNFIFGFTFNFSAVALLFVGCGAVLQGCDKTIALEITNIYENGDTALHYDYCEDINDGRGFTSGIAGFCTGTGDAWLVIQEYHKLSGGKDQMSTFDPVLAEYAKTGNNATTGLSGYCTVWNKLGSSDSKFKQAQDTIRDSLYMDPAMDYAKQLGLKTSIAQGQLYDAGIQHGASDGPDGLGGMIAKTNALVTADEAGDSGSTLTVNGHKIDEIAWLNRFLGVRADVLSNPREPTNMSGAWAKTLYRIKSYQYAVGAKEYNWGDSVKVLDNDGKPITVTCAMALSSRQDSGVVGLSIARWPLFLIMSLGFYLTHVGSHRRGYR
ncbi:hypothetical protein GGH91_001241 [Coemansia sp. RSA 2671]|nr:hypothetical protein LPJ60_003441 [Coemansia sp. RSA 2675]KAJ2348685.1 hypothetical protein GGH91_001241 [Coemansia sp. RSA 2671]